MRNVSKFKLLRVRNLFFKNIPYRVLKLKKQKWAWFISKFKKDYAFQTNKKTWKRRIFINISKKKVSLKYWTKLQFTYKNEQETKRLTKFVYNNALKKAFFRKQKATDYIDFRISILVKPVYRQDLLLWFLNFFENTRLAKHYIQLGKVLINDNKKRGTKFLAFGDKLEITDYLFDLPALRKKYYRTKKLAPFCIVDYYTNILFIVKEYKNIGKHDVPFVMQVPLNCKLLRCRY